MEQVLQEDVYVLAQEIDNLVVNIRIIQEKVSFLNHKAIFDSNYSLQIADHRESKRGWGKKKLYKNGKREFKF